MASDRADRRLPADAVLHRRIGARLAARSTRRRRAGRRQPHVLHGGEPGPGLRRFLGGRRSGEHRQSLRPRRRRRHGLRAQRRPAARQAARRRAERARARGELAADAANLGTWTPDLVRDNVLASRNAELFSFAPEGPLNIEQLVQRIHVDDRPAFRDRLSQAARRRGDYQSEFRWSCPTASCAGSPPSGGSTSTPKGNPLRSRGAVSTSRRGKRPSRRCCACARTSPTSARSR